MERMFPINENTPELKFASIALDVWSALDKIERTGWVMRGVKNPETVQSHTVSLRNIAASILELKDEEREGLLDMLEVHDWPEVINGDEVILSVDEEELKTLKASKFEKEQIALTSICEKLEEKGKEIVDLWLRFETSNDPAAVFARQLDKYQAIEQALEYEKEQGIPLFKEFLDYGRRNINHPFLLDRIKRLEEEFLIQSHFKPSSPKY
jgi:putative hydrolase of HD superfamily